MPMSKRPTALRIMTIVGTVTLTVLGLAAQGQAASAQPTIITLTQTGCQFVEVGEYVYSCSLNPPPDYRLVVKR
jgi:hypothetical protein